MYTKKFEPTLWPDLMAFSDRSAEDEFRLPVENENDGGVCKTISPSANLLRDSVSELPGERGMPGKDWLDGIDSVDQAKV